MELKTATETVLEVPNSWSRAPGAPNKACVPFCPTETIVSDEAVACNLAGCEINRSAVCMEKLGDFVIS